MSVFFGNIPIIAQAATDCQSAGRMDKSRTTNSYLLSAVGDETRLRYLMRTKYLDARVEMLIFFTKSVILSYGKGGIQ